MPTSTATLASRVEEGLLGRNQLYGEFFSREAPRLASACRDMSDRFLKGGRLLAFGRGPYATDAQHVSVEFVHPVIVGKRALPALDLSMLFGPWLTRNYEAGRYRDGLRSSRRRPGSSGRARFGRRASMP